METPSGWKSDQKSLIDELIQGMELTKQLRAELSSASGTVTVTEEGKVSLLQGILSSYEKALCILKWRSGSNGGSLAEAAAPPGLPESPISINGSHSSDDSGLNFKDHDQDLKVGSKKRKTQPRWTEQVKVNSETGFEGPHEDGYNWRKYGQKDILGAKYPRSYYRCTFRSSQNCGAVKRVQRLDEDPSVFEITYRGKHSCSQGSYLVQSLTSPEKQEKKQKNKQTSQEGLVSFQAIMEKTEKPDDKRESSSALFCFASTSMECSNNFELENTGFSHLAIDTADNTLGSFSQSFISPTTPESSYFVPSPFQPTNTGGVHNAPPPCSESGINEIFSTNNSVTNSPILDWDFSLDTDEHINSNFQFNSHGFFY